MEFKKLLNDNSVVYRTCKTARKEVNPTSLIWLLIFGIVIPIVSGDDYYSYLVGIAITIVMAHFMIKLYRSLDEIGEYEIYREVLSGMVLFVSMIIFYGIPVYYVETLGNFITIAIFLWVIPPLITSIALITPSLIDLSLLGKIKIEKKPNENETI